MDNPDDALWRAEKRDPNTNQEFRLNETFSSSSGLFYPLAVLQVVVWYLPFASVEHQARFADIIARLITTSEDATCRRTLLKDYQKTASLRRMKWQTVAIGNLAYHIKYNPDVTEEDYRMYVTCMRQLREELVCTALLWFLGWVASVGIILQGTLGGILLGVATSPLLLALPLLVAIFMLHTEPVRPLTITQGCLSWFNSNIPNAKELYEKWGDEKTKS